MTSIEKKCLDMQVYILHVYNMDMSVYLKSAIKLCLFFEWVHYSYVSLLNGVTTARSVYCL